MHLPSHHAFLRAGIARPDIPAMQHPWHTPRTTIARDGVPAEVADEVVALATPPDDSSGGARSLTVLDEDGGPAAVIEGRSRRFLARPLPELAQLRAPREVERHKSGALIATYDTVNQGMVRQREVQGGLPEGARAVTIDLSVIFEGLDPSKFAPQDALFVSVALALDITAVGRRGPTANNGDHVGAHFFTWDLTTPVPIDTEVLSVYRELFDSTMFNADDHPLDRTDLLCAATAIVYDAPLYTTKPEAFKTLKNGLKVLRYGSRRSKVVPEIADQLRSKTEILRSRYEAGEAWDEESRSALLAARSDGVQLVDALIHILGDENPDHSWRTGILREAEQLRSPVLLCWNRPDLFGVVGSYAWPEGVELAKPGAVELKRLALEALALWGRWPEDADESVLFDIAEDPTEEFSLEWTRIYLRSALVPERKIEHELARIIAGEVTPTKEYFDERLAAQGWVRNPVYEPEHQERT